MNRTSRPRATTDASAGAGTAPRPTEARLAEAQAIGRVGDFVIRPDGTGTASPEVFRNLGLSGDASWLPFEDFLRLVHPDDRLVVEANYRTIMAGELDDSAGPVRVLFRVVRPDGQPITLSAVMVCERGADGCCERVCGTVQDVSELEQAIASARERGSRFEALFTRTLDGVYFASLDRPIRWDDAADKEALLDYVFEHLRMAAYNDVFCQQTGLAPGQGIGLTPRQFLLDPVEAWRRRTRDVLDHGQRNERIVLSQPSGRIIEGQTVCLYDASGAVTGLFGISRDVTEREAEAERARQTRDRLELALVAGELYIWDLDVPTGELYCDPRWLGVLGYAPEDVGPTVEWWTDMMHPDDFAALVEARTRALAGFTDHVALDIRTRAKDGAFRVVHCRGKVLARDEHGQGLRIAGTNQDLTERRQLEQRVRLAERLASVGTLVAGAAHEINNPLSFVTSNLQHITSELAELTAALAAGGTFDRAQLDDLRDAAADAATGADRIRNIVRDLRTFAGSDDDVVQPVELLRVLELGLQLSGAQIHHRARLVRELAPVPPVLGNEGRLSQVFVNILVNAAQSIPVGAAHLHEVRVRTGLHADGRVMVEISDTGRGIPAEAIGRIFDPFFTTKAVGEGMGLGLSISHAIVAEVGGEIEVESAIGRGSCFRVLLRVADPAPAVPAAPSRWPASTSAQGGRLKLLVIDDEPLAVRLLGRLLSDHDVVIETRGADALARIAAGERFDRILCDLMMPEVSGMDVFEALGQIAPDQQRAVIFVTGGAFTDAASGFLRQVPNVRLHKPFDLAELEAALERPLS